MLYQMAMDYLPVQGNTVPCEWIFLSSVETDMKKRNQIKLLLIKALQIFKFHHKKICLDFIVELVLTEEDLKEEDPNDLLTELLSCNQSCVEDPLDKILNSLRDRGEETLEDDGRDRVNSDATNAEDAKDSEDGEETDGLI